MMVPALSSGARALIERVEALRREATSGLDPERRRVLGQFMTPAQVSRLMASLLSTPGRSVRCLDAGAGIGSLTAALVARYVSAPPRPSRLHLTAFEIDTALIPYLRRTVALCERACKEAGIDVTSEIRAEDFIRAGVATLEHPLLPADRDVGFDCAVLNPPYRKIRSDSAERRLLRGIGVETSNLYTAFLSIALKMVREGGEIVAITPRSFCNGPYFRPFRRLLLREARLGHLHVFHARDRAFSEDDVLQENIVFRARKGGDCSDLVVSASAGPDDPHLVSRRARYSEVVAPDDPEAFIRLPLKLGGSHGESDLRTLSCSLHDLDLEVSTGRVVDFRAREHLRAGPTDATVPLIYPLHLRDGGVRWPAASGKKPNAIMDVPETRDLLVPRGTYVVVKRFSAKEEARRVVGAVFDPRWVPAERVGFENHLNYFHRGGRGLPEGIARGLSAFLNSTMVDVHFREFSGHTQVNATDLRSLRYPDIAQLERLGARVPGALPAQRELDCLVRAVLFGERPTRGRAAGSRRLALARGSSRTTDQQGAP